MNRVKEKKKPKLRYIAALQFAAVNLGLTGTALILGSGPIILYILGGILLGTINVLTLYIIRNQTEYEW